MGFSQNHKDQYDASFKPKNLHIIGLNILQNPKNLIQAFTNCVHGHGHNVHTNSVTGIRKIMQSIHSSV